MTELPRRRRAEPRRGAPQGRLPGRETPERLGASPPLVNPIPRPGAGDGPAAADRPPERLDLGAGRHIAYHRFDPVGDGGSPPSPEFPGVVFLGGFRSDMTGTKALHLEGWARKAGRAFLRFDYTGHGASSGRFEEGAIGEWADDAYEAASRLTAGPQILVGSSMGGWIALLLMKRWLAAGEGARLAGFVGIAAAPDFTEDSMAAGFTEAQHAALLRDGQVELPSDYDDTPYVITRRLIEDGRSQLVLRAPLALPVPIRLLQGTADADVPPSVALRLLEHVACPDARLILVKDADHRMSEPRELRLLTKTIESLP